MVGERLTAIPDNASKLVDEIRQKGLIAGLLNGAIRVTEENAKARQRFRKEGFGILKR